MQSGKLKQGLWGEKRGRGKTRLLLSSCHMWTLSLELPFLISSVCLITAFDTCIDHFLNCAHRGIFLPLSGQLSLCLSFPPPLFVDTDVACREGCFQKYIFLITCLLGERGTSMLGWVAKKNPALLSNISSYHGERLTKKNGPCVWCWSPAQSLILDCRFQRWKALLRQPSCNLGIPQKSLKQHWWAKQKPILQLLVFFPPKKLKILVKHIQLAGALSLGREVTWKKNFRLLPACVRDSESSTLPFYNRKAYIQFNFMHFRLGSV